MADPAMGDYSAAMPSGLLSGLGDFEGTNLLLGILGLGALVAIHELGHHLVALWTGMKVRRFSIGFGPAIFSRTHKGVDYTIGAIPFGGFVDVLGNNPLEDGAMSDPRSFQRRPRWARAAMVFAGPAFNFGLAWVLLVAAYGSGAVKKDMEYVVDSVVAGSAAEVAGLQPDDVLISIGDDAITGETSVPDIVGKYAQQDVPVKVRRAGETLTVRATPRGEPGHGMLGIGLARMPAKDGRTYTVVESLEVATTLVIVGSGRILSDVARLLTPGEKVEVGGPVAIVQVLKRSASRSFLDLVLMLATLSLVLALMNLLPFPPFDGSKLLMLGLEVLARRDIPAKAQVIVHGVGFLAMVALMIVVTFNDIFGPDKFAPRTRQPPPAATAPPAAAEAAPAPVPAP